MFLLSPPHSSEIMRQEPATQWGCLWTSLCLLGLSASKFLFPLSLDYEDPSLLLLFFLSLIPPPFSCHSFVFLTLQQFFSFSHTGRMYILFCLIGKAETSQSLDFSKLLCVMELSRVLIIIGLFWWSWCKNMYIKIIMKLQNLLLAWIYFFLVTLKLFTTPNIYIFSWQICSGLWVILRWHSLFHAA